MRRLVLPAAAVVLAAAALPVLLPVLRPAPCVVPGPLVWFERTATAVRGLPDASASRTWAVAWTAADRAVQRRTGAQADAAVAGAVSTVLGQRACADDPHVAAGAEAARELLDARAGDGLLPAQVDVRWSPPPPRTGVWRPTPPDGAPAGSAGLPRARPFLLRAADEVRTAPPAALGSARYAADLDEVRRLGARDSRERDERQVEVARFWEASSVTVFTDAVRQVAPSLPTPALTALLSDLHRVTTDVQIAVAAAKFASVRWRPVTAVRVDGDGDARTLKDRHWTPLSATPPNPEHPGGHAAYATAAVLVLEAHLGRDADVVLHSPTGAPRHCALWVELVQENVDGRVWGGLHLRSSGTAGVALGRDLARTALARVPARPDQGTRTS